MIITPAEFRRDAARLPRLRRALRARGVDPDAVPGLSAQAIEETLRCLGPMGLGGIATSGFATYAGGYPWSGNTNVAAMWIADAEYITLASSDVASWTTQQAYTSGGTPTTYTLSQGDTGLDPEWNATGINGAGAVSFDGSAEWLGCDESNFLALLQGDDQPFAVLALLRVNSSAGGQRFWCLSDTASTSSVLELFEGGVSGNWQLRKKDDAGGNHNRDSNESVDTGLVVARWDCDGTSSHFYLSGVVAANDPMTHDVTDLSGADAFTLAACRSNSTTAHDHSECDVAALAVVINDDTTAAQAIEDWLLTRGGL